MKGDKNGHTECKLNKNVWKLIFHGDIKTFQGEPSLPLLPRSYGPVPQLNIKKSETFSINFSIQFS